MSRLNNYNIFRAALWYTVGNILIRGISFFTLPVFTALMDTHDYGIYSVYTSYLSILETVILFGLSSTISMAKFSDDLDYDAYLSAALVIPPMLSLAGGVGVAFYLGAFEQLFSMDATLWTFLLINAAATAVSSIVQAKLILDGRYQVYILYSALYTFLNLGLSLVLCYTVYRSHDMYMARVVGNCVASVLAALGILPLSRIRVSLQRKCFQKAFRWGLPLLFHTLATVLLTQTDRILIQRIEGFSTAGIYSVAVTITVIPLTLLTSLNSAWNPWLLDQLEQKNYPLIRTVNHQYLLLFTVIIGEMMLISPEIIHIFADEAYWESIYSLIPLLLSVFGEMLYSLPVSVEYYHKKTSYIMTGTLLCLVCNVVLDIIMIFSFGYIAAAYATAISKLLLFFFHAVLARKLDKNPIFEKRYALLAMLLLILLNLLVTTQVDQLLLRLGLFVLVGVLFLGWIWKNRRILLASFLHKPSQSP